MILTLTGTHPQPFTRLVDAVNALHTDEERIIQHGTTLPFTRVLQLMQQARVIITHAGTATVMQSLSLGKIPVVAPRLARYGEHVDDHQLELVHALTAQNLIVPFMPGDDLAQAIAQCAHQVAQRPIAPAPQLVDYLKELLAA